MYLNYEVMNYSLSPAYGYDRGLIPPKRDMTLVLHCYWAVDHVSCQQEFCL